ncbi:hypothetical protein [Streptomyces sp. NRRL B-24484]|uniref:hypothetical protein n=1 Tax=Streptomyces sp. NRRL B-24484 TaxID=1463833 RepID=UPI0004BEC773|nr:hypothetical protein [Streptomyces sp. NRRL B-24484]
MTQTTAADPLTEYPPHIQDAIRSEAHAWFHDHIEPARGMYESHRTWALRLTPEQRRRHSSDAWYANQLLKRAAIAEVQKELGDPLGGI